MNYNHFYLLYDKNIDLNKEEKYKEGIKFNNKNKNIKVTIKYQGQKFINKYMLTKYKGGE